MKAEAAKSRGAERPDRGLVLAKDRGSDLEEVRMRNKKLEVDILETSFNIW